MNAFQALANAIVLQACQDYRHALKVLKRLPKDPGAMGRCMEIERFFHSSYFDVLTNLDGDVILEKLRKEALA